MGRGHKQKEPASKSPCPSRNCQNHTFEMVSHNAAGRHRFDCKLEFCPKLSNISKRYESILPMLNADGKVYTPCFILEGDVAHYRERDEKYREIHELKLEEYLRSRKELVRIRLESLPRQNLLLSETLMQLEPKHARKSLTCAVCRSVYTDYRDHIHSEQHKINVRENPYNDHILDLVASWQNDEQSESGSFDQTESELRLSVRGLSTPKTKKQRKSDKQAAKVLTIQHYASIFTQAYSRQQRRSQGSSEEVLPVDLQQHSFRVEDYLFL